MSIKSSIIYCKLSVQDGVQPSVYIEPLHNPIRQVLLQVRVRGFVALSMDRDMLRLQSARTPGYLGPAGDHRGL